MPDCLEQTIQRSFELLIGLKSYLDGIEAALDQSHIDIVFTQSFNPRTDAQLNYGSAAFLPQRVLDLILPLNFEMPEKIPATKPL